MPRLFAEKPLKLSKLPSYRAEHFPSAGPYPWLDLPDAEEQIEGRLSRQEISEEQAALCRYWCAHGYVILPKAISDDLLNEIWTTYEQAVACGNIHLDPEPAAEGDPYPGRFLDPHRKSGMFCRLLKHRKLTDALRLLLGHPPKPLQTITSHKGSQQGLHSDSIHMTTYPIGYLAAAWIAFEDIHPDSGPLVYYPGSHRLPYVFSKDVGISEDEFNKEGYTKYRDNYEPFIRNLVEDNGFEAKYFHASKGDVLIWHANLVHGGSPRRDLQLSRKAVVCHYYAKGAFVYHDLSASISKKQYMGTCLLRDNEGNLFGPKGLFGK